MEVEHGKILEEVRAEHMRDSFNACKKVKANYVGQFEVMEQRKDHYKGLVIAGNLVFDDSDVEDKVPKTLEVPSGTEVVEDPMMMISEGFCPKEILDELAPGGFIKVDNAVSPPVKSSTILNLPKDKVANAKLSLSNLRFHRRTSSLSSSVLFLQPLGRLRSSKVVNCGRGIGTAATCGSKSPCPSGLNRSLIGRLAGGGGVRLRVRRLPWVVDAEDMNYLHDNPDDVVLLDDDHENDVMEDFESLESVQPTTDINTAGGYTKKDAYNVVFLGAIIVLIVAIDTNNGVLLLLSIVAVLVLFLVVHVYVTALWHIASVVSVLEPIYGFAAMKKSRELLKGKTRDAGVLVLGYVSVCGLISGLFGTLIVRGGANHGVMFRVLIGGVLVGVLVIVNLTGLLVQSVFYYVCKSYHHQGIDKSALYEHLGGYLGEYVPLKSSVQMENLDV
ncbi:hypothetical protein GIB67_027650 [Kingdonia uniflora]|uniref:Uncharacterized protein n=1 Tax=Kingdonia uniflora TaxID=39325 RepID=A0A7J7NLM7_9MAGN|nr:hypothetical protein GIB67_027650 [Kingdonia uniflora]